MLGEDEPLRVRHARASATISRGRCSFCLSQTGIAVWNELKPRGANGEVRLQQPLELQQRLVVERRRSRAAPA